MKQKVLLSITFCLVFVTQAFTQYRLTCIIRDAASHQPLAGASVFLPKEETGTTTDTAGRAVLTNLRAGLHLISFSSLGYITRSGNYAFPVADSIVVILLQKAEEKTEAEIIVSSSRTESGIENLPTKVEVLGAEEVSEEVGIKPGNIASLLGDVAGIQMQQTSATTGNMEMRIQGLPGKYTQLLKDGMPLFGDYSGSFSILQIPPLDLKQIEIVKGASSTLYGGGAIAGMVNLVSKRPKEGIFEKTVLLNRSTLHETNANVYLSNRKHKLGYTFFTGYNDQKAVDVNKDGFSDLPSTKSFFLHPTLYLYPGNNNLVYIGYNGVFENRKGGDMQVLHNKADNQHRFFIANNSYRHTVDGSWENRINARDRFTLKGTASWFDRNIATHAFGMKAHQLSYYTEASYLKKWKKNDLVAGLNITGERFHKRLPDSTQIDNYNQATLGLFLQDDWKISSLCTMQAGLRWDHHNQYGDFVLPRLSVLYKISPYFTTRLGGGLGYKIPSVFSSDIDERDYLHLLPLQQVKAERSQGINWDINYHQKINGWDLTANQSFFLNRITNPIVTATAGNNISFFNAGKPITTRGFESYVQLLHDKLEIYMGYILTSARKLYDNDRPHVSLIARNKFATVLAYEFSDAFRAGVEAAYTGRQYLDDGSRTPGYLFMAAMVRLDVKKISFVVNCENLLDYRQTKKEAIVIPPADNPGFGQLWAPIDGRVVNFSVRIKL